MADIVRDIYDPTLRQDKVIFQQKKPLLNYELNLAQDILKNRGIDLTQLSISNNYTGDALQVYASNLNNEIWIRQGTFYHLGRPIQLSEDIRYTGLNTPLVNRTDTVFVEWYVEEIGATQDPTIVDPVLGFETARQDRLNVTIVIAEGSDIPTPSAGSNFFTIAKLKRIAGNALITSAMIEDDRDKVVYNFVVWGCLVGDGGGLNASISEGDLFVGDTEFFIESTTPLVSLAPSATSYVYVEKVSGYVQANTTEPLDFHVLLAMVVTDASSITSITDKRPFRPIAWNYKYSDADRGDTGYPSITEKFKAGENLLEYDVVYISGSRTVSRASALSSGHLPCIGISPQNFTSGQIDNIVIFGQIKNRAWSWTVGGDVFLDVNVGMLTQTAPISPDTYVQRIGVAVSSDILFFNPDRIYIQNKTSEIPLIVMRQNGDLEIIGSQDRISPTRLSWLAPIETIPNDRTFSILSGIYYIDDTTTGYYPGGIINLGPSQAYQTTAINSTWFNKAAFTLRDDNTVQMYEGISSNVLTSVEDPVIPSNELPICIVSFQDNGPGLAGTIFPIAQSAIKDIRDWLNMGNLDATAFKPFYRDESTFGVQKGSAWFNNGYITLSTNLSISGTVSPDATYYIYLDYNNATGSVDISSFVIMTDSLVQVDRRRYMPLGQYIVSSGLIQRSSFTAYDSKFWHYRDSLYTNEQIYTTPSPGGQSIFNLTDFTFLDSDYLDITTNGVEVFEGALYDYIKTAPVSIVFNYTIKKNAEVRIRKV